MRVTLSRCPLSTLSTEIFQKPGTDMERTTHGIVVQCPLFRVRPQCQSSEQQTCVPAGAKQFSRVRITSSCNIMTAANGEHLPSVNCASSYCVLEARRLAARAGILLVGDAMKCCRFPPTFYQSLNRRAGRHSTPLNSRGT